MVGDKMMEIVLITIYLGCLIVVFKDIRTTVIDVLNILCEIEPVMQANSDLCDAHMACGNTTLKSTWNEIFKL